MGTFKFKYYIDDDYTINEVRDFLAEDGMPLDLATDIAHNRPFYEVTLHCSVDTETNKVTIESAEL